MKAVKLKPKYVIWENVKNVISKKHKHNFDNYINKMDELGYVSYYQVLNAKDYGIPQNRERVFTVSIRDDTYFSPNSDDVVEDESTYFEFPPKQELKLKLKDMLEDNVDEKYYLSEEMINKIKYKFKNENDLLGGMQEHQSIKKDGICTTLTSSMGCGGGYVPMVSRKYGIFDNKNETHQAGSVYDENGLSPTLDTMQGGWRQPCIEDTSNLRIRKLTPKECWRLMGFDDEDFNKAGQVNSNTQLYKQAGNSIVVNVLESVFKILLQDYMDDWDLSELD